MNKYYIYLTILILAFIACTNKSPIESEFELSPLITEEMVGNVNLEPGIKIDSLKLKDGRVWKFGLSIPKIEAEEKVPLVIALHWFAEDEVYERYLRCLAEPGFADLNAIIFAPDNGEEEFWDYNNYTVILTLIEYSKKYWPIDENKIVVSGYSNGAIASWFFGINYPQIFSAAIPIAGTSNYANKLKIPFYVIHGTNDELFPVEDTIERVRVLTEFGSEIKLSTALGLSHFAPCSYVDKSREASSWVLNEVWD